MSTDVAKTKPDRLEDLLLVRDFDPARDERRLLILAENSFQPLHQPDIVLRAAADAGIAARIQLRHQAAKSVMSDMPPYPYGAHVLIHKPSGSMIGCWCVDIYHTQIPTVSGIHASVADFLVHKEATSNAHGVVSFMLDALEAQMSLLSNFLERPQCLGIVVTRQIFGLALLPRRFAADTNPVLTIDHGYAALYRKIYTECR